MTTSRTPATAGTPTTPRISRLQVALLYIALAGLAALVVAASQNGGF